MTADERALLNAILAAPDDDLPRLVYADWLEEHGRAERAELIRIECELGDQDSGSSDYHNRTGPLFRRLVELLQAHHDRWVAEATELPRGRDTHYYLKRGMVGSVSCTVAFFRENAAAMFTAAPIEDVRLIRLGVRNAARLSDVAEWTRVRRLTLSPFFDVPAEAVVAALRVESLWSMPVLDFSAYANDTTTDAWHTRWATVAAAVASDARSAGLRGLDFTRSGVGNEGALALANSPHLTGLSWINLQDNPLDDGTRHRLRERFGRRLILHPADRVGFRYRDLLGLSRLAVP